MRRSGGMSQLVWVCLLAPWLVWAQAAAEGGIVKSAKAGAIPAHQAKQRDNRPGVHIAEQSKTSQNQIEEFNQPNVLLVTLLDGRIVGVDGNTGARLWAYDSGAPLVSVTQTDTAAGGFNIFPGIDGTLYAYHGLESGEAQLERLPLTLPELVAASPSLAVDGSVVLGTRVSTVFALHRQSGQLVRLLSGVAGALGDTSTEGVQVPNQYDPSSMVLVGREDFIVRSMQAHSGQETWNATFARVMQLHPLAGQRAPTDARPLGDSSEEPPQRPRRSKPLGVRLATASDNALQAYDAVTGYRRWSIKFEAPPIAAFDTSMGSDGRNQLEPGPAPPATGGSNPAAQQQAPVPPAPAPGPNQQVLVGMLHGSLYAIPTHMIACVPGTGPFTPQSLPSSGRHVPALPASPSPMQHQPNQTSAPQSYPGSVWQAEEPGVSSAANSTSNGDVSSTALVAVSDAAALGAMSHVDKDHAPMVSSLVCPLGVHALAGSPSGGQPNCSVPHIPFLPPPRNTSTDLQDNTSSAKDSNIESRWQAMVALVAACITLLFALTGAYWARGYVSSGQPTSAATQQNGAALAHWGSSAGTISDSDAFAALLAHKDPALNSVNDWSNHSNASSKRGRVAQLNQASRKNSTVDGAVNGPTSREPSEYDPGSDFLRSQEAAAMTADGHSYQQVRDASNHSSTGGLQLSPAGSGGGMGDPAALTRVAQLQADGSIVMGRLRVGPGILGYGSAGTIVYEGYLDGRPVAVKRLLRQFYDLARKEIEVLIVSDEHPNVVRCFAMEEDREFVYLALERCKKSLADALAAPMAKSAFLDTAGTGPSQHCMDIMQQVVQGLTALHERGIVHRDVKPHNVLLTEAGRVKLSDMGLSRQLVAEQSSFESHGAGGSSGWQSPEQLIARGGGTARQTRSMDVFSLGCLLYYCVTAGKHPYGESYERDAAILRGKPNLVPLSNLPEACNLLASMLAREAEARPVMQAVCGHPMWWTFEQRLQFLVDISDRVENEDREPDQRLLAALESHAMIALQPAGAPNYGLMIPTPNWGGAVEAELVANLGRYRRYDYTSLRDLLRVVRNKRNHFREMPKNLQDLLGPLPHGYLTYFTSRFPNLLMAVWVFALRNLSEEQLLAHYWCGGAQLYDRFVQTFLAAHPQRMHPAASTSLPPPAPLPHLATIPEGIPTVQPSVQPAGVKDANSTPAAHTIRSLSPARSKAQASSPSPSQPTTPMASQARDDLAANLQLVAQGDAQAQASQAASPAVTNKAGKDTAKQQQPPAPPPCVGFEIDPVAAEADGGVGGGPGTYVREFPRRTGKQICDFYSKTGHCKFGDTCIFDHPESMAVQLTALHLPLRPGQPVCPFYLKNNDCKFGAACKFHHPILRPVVAGQVLASVAISAATAASAAAATAAASAATAGAASAVLSQVAVAVEIPSAAAIACTAAAEAGPTADVLVTADVVPKAADVNSAHSTAVEAPDMASQASPGLVTI